MTDPDRAVRPGLVFQPVARQNLLNGVHQILQAIRPTLGPLPRLVACASLHRGKSPEMLDDGGLIARRIIQLADYEADIGAMYIRHMLWQLRERVGDGTATAAVLFETVYREGVRYITAGGNPARLRHFLEQGTALILDTLSAMAIRISGKQQLARIAETICHDPELAVMLGEIFEILGEHGHLDILTTHQRTVDREYTEGMHWSGGVLSRSMLTDQAKLRVQLDNPAILLSDAAIESSDELLPVLEIAAQSNIKSLLIVAQSISDNAVGFLHSARIRERIQVVAVKLLMTGDIEDDAATVYDLAALTGARPVLAKGGSSLAAVRQDDLGRARRAWAERSQFGLAGGKGDPRQLRQYILALQNALAKADDPARRRKLQERIGKFLGGSATLWVGGITETEIAYRKALAERAARALRGALLEGVLPGGGVALLNCRAPLSQHITQSVDTDERAAYRILLRAVEEPFRVLLTNAGYDPGEAMAQIDHRGAVYGFDVRTGQVTDMAAAGICDITSTQKEAARSAVTSAALALTVDVLVYHKNPEQVFQP